MIKLSIVILSWNTKDLLCACLDSIYSGPRPLPFETIVVDNGSHDGSAQAVKELFPEARVIENDRNEGYARGNNIGVRAARGEYILLLNSDTRVIGDAPEQLVAFLDDQRDYGAAGPQLLNPDGTIQRACMRFPTLTTAFFYGTLWERAFGPTRCIRRYYMEDFDHAHAKDVDQPPGACFMVPRRVFDAVGLLDESLFLFFNDVDLCVRLRANGHRIRFCADAQVVHYGGQSTRRYPLFVQEWTLNRLRYYRKHYGWRGAAMIKLVTWLRAIEEMIRIAFRHRGADRRTAWQGVTHVLALMMKE
ncbi:MAG: glycosyltransferase family 2 protein [Planctomycetota bacterium]